MSLLYTVINQLTKHSWCPPCHHLSDNVPHVVTPVGGDSVVLGHVQCHCILWQWLVQRQRQGQKRIWKVCDLGLELVCCQVSNFHSINVNRVPLSGVAGTVGLILKQGSCTQEGYVKVKQFSALEGQPDTGVHYITMSCIVSSYI